jgi:hypothetical protein
MATRPVQVHNARVVAALLFRHDIAGLALSAKQPAHGRFTNVKQLGGSLVRAAALRSVCRDNSPTQIDRKVPHF